MDWARLQSELVFLRASAVDLAAVTALGDGPFCDDLRHGIRDRWQRLAGRSGVDFEGEIDERIAPHGQVVSDPQKTSGSLRDAVGFVFSQCCTDGDPNADLAHLGGAMFAALYDEVHQLLEAIDLAAHRYSRVSDEAPLIFGKKRTMKRIGILTAGGDTPALNATIHGAVARASQLRLEIFGFIKGFNSLLNPRLPHVHLNPLMREIPELDATMGGMVLGASRDYLSSDNPQQMEQIYDRLRQLQIEGLICIGGDGTLNGLQPLTERLPVVLAPKTIDNDLCLNYPSEPDQCTSMIRSATGHKNSSLTFNQEHMVNYATPGYATAVFDSAMGVERVRTTAESHRRIAIIEVMGRHSGYIALGSAFGRPDIILIPESPVHIDPLVERIMELHELQKNVVIVCGEGIKDEEGNELGAGPTVYDVDSRR